MKLFINAYTLRVAGGLSVGTNFFKYLYQNQHHLDIIAFVPPNCGYEKFARPNIRLVVAEPWMLNPLFKMYINNVLLPKLVNKFKADVVFSMGNIAFPSPVKQLLLFHLPHAAYEQKYWGKLNLYEKLYAKSSVLAVKKTLQYADIIAPQTQTMMKRLSAIYGIEQQKFVVIPNAVSITSGKRKEVAKRFFEKEPGCKYLLMLSKYYGHKNFELLIETAKLIKEKGKNIRFVITINEAQGKGAKKIVDLISKHNLEKIIINTGPVDFEDVPILYHETDGLIMPTLLESFSGTYVEAMFYQKPVFTSDMDFAREICGEAAYYFNPFSAESCMQTIVKGFSDVDLLREKISLGENKVKELPDWSTVGNKYITELNKLL